MDIISIKNRIILLFLFFLTIYNAQSIHIRKLFFNYEIILTIKGTGTKQIFSENYGYQLPNHIYINDASQNQIKRKYNLNGETNTIRLVWGDIEGYFSLAQMFSGCNTLILPFRV